MKHRRAVLICALLASTVALASCSHASPRAGTPSASAGPKTDVLVTMGSDATFGDGLTDPLHDSWPQRLYHAAFARSAVLVNAADRAVTVDRALVVEVPLALDQHATVVAIWLGDADLEQNTSPASFESGLDALVKPLLASDARVLIGNLPRGVPGAAAYDDVMARVAKSRGATLVDLATALAATPDLGPTSLVTVKTSAQIADAFGAALARS